MFPIAVVAGVIGAVVSVAQGASWVSGHLDSSKDTTSVGSKGEAKSGTDAKLSPSFEAALTAQVTGQGVPASTATTPAASNVVSTQQYGTDYDALARAKAGITAYNHVGEHRSSHDSDNTAVSQL